MFRAIVDEIRERGGRPIILILPSKADDQATVEGRAPVFQSLVDRLIDLELPFLDASEAFVLSGNTSVEPWFEPGSHYSGTGNRLIASWLGAYLLRLE